MGINAGLDNDGKVNELVELIDRLIAGGDGHITVNAEDILRSKKENETQEGDIRVKRYRSSDCGTGACCQPLLYRPHR